MRFSQPSCLHSGPFRALGLLLALTLPAAAQTPTENPVFPAALDEVHVTVTVQDESGQLVSGLRPEDFVVLEEGRPQKVELFGRAVEPGQEDAMALDLGLLMDTSQSMLKELKLSQEAAVRFLDSIPRARDLVTIFFDDDIRISRYDSENQQGLFERIHKLKGGGNTALYDAISVYLSRVQDSGGRKVLVLFTDGEDSRSAVSLAELTKLVRASPVAIYSVAFTGSFHPSSARALRARNILDQLATVSGGRSSHRARRGTFRASTTRSWRSSGGNTCWATCPTTRGGTGSSAGSRSRWPARTPGCGTAAGTSPRGSDGVVSSTSLPTGTSPRPGARTPCGAASVPRRPPAPASG